MSAIFRWFIPIPVYFKISLETKMDHNQEGARYIFWRQNTICSPETWHIINKIMVQFKGKYKTKMHLSKKLVKWGYKNTSLALFMLKLKNLFKMLLLWSSMVQINSQWYVWLTIWCLETILLFDNQFPTPDLKDNLKSKEVILLPLSLQIVLEVVIFLLSWEADGKRD